MSASRRATDPGRSRAGAPARCTPSTARVLACLLLWLAIGDSGAQLSAGTAPATSAAEQRVKAASLFRFLGYVEWPTAANDVPYRIGVLGADDVTEELASVVTGRMVNGRSVTIRRLQPSDPISDIDELYIGYADGSKMASAVLRAQGQPLLIVTSADGALAHGSMVNFRIVDDRVRFEVALDAVEQAGLRISSRMLSVAVQVTRNPPR